MLPRVLVTRAPLFLACCAGLFAGALALACESSEQIGELAPRAEDASTPPVTFPPVAEDASTPTALSWRLHAPTVPCSIYAMDEERSDALFLGCNGGRVYRFDGVRADLSLELEDTRLVSLLWAGPDGSVWAGAQSGYDAKATTELHRFDGTTWSKVVTGGERITSLTGTSATDVWITTPSQIRRWNGAAFAPSYTATAGELRACTFAAADMGWCTGTSGLAVSWNGASWTPMTAVPWSASAEVFGVEVNPFDSVPTFFWGEPVKGPNGENAEIHVATWKADAFQPRTAKVPSFTSFRVPRKRTGHVVVNGRLYMLLLVEEQYGQALVHDPYEDVFRSLCAPALASSAGSAKTRIGGFDGLLATVVGSGQSQLALSTQTTTFEPHELSVAPSGAVWARVEDTTACGSITDRLVRYEDGQWRDVAGPQPVQSGRSLAAIAFDQAYTLTAAEGILGEYKAGTWADRGTFDNAWSLWAKKQDDVWIGGYTDELAHFDGKTITTLVPKGAGRQVKQVVEAAGVVWMVALGYTQDDTDVHVYRFANGKREEWNLGIESYGTHVSALDATHVWLSGRPAKAWNGTTWKDLPFDASNVWARTEDEVYFTFGGDIFRWDGKTKERVYHGFVGIRGIDGSRDRGIAIGPGGLTIELGVFPVGTK